MTLEETYFPVELWREILSYNKIPKAPKGRSRSADIIHSAANNVHSPTILKTCIQCNEPTAWMLVFADKVFFRIDEGDLSWLCKSCIKTYRIPSIIY